MQNLSRAVRQFSSPKVVRYFRNPAKVVNDPDFAPQSIVFVGTKDSLQHPQTLNCVHENHRDMYQSLLKDLSPGSTSSFAFQHGQSLVHLHVSVLPAHKSRSLAPSKSHAITKQLSGLVNGSKTKNQGIILALERISHALPAACAVAKLHTLYSQKTSSPPSSNNNDNTNNTNNTPKETRVSFVAIDGSNFSDSEFVLLQTATEKVREAGMLGDMPAEEMNTTQFHEHIQKWFDKQSNSAGLLSMHAIVGEELEKQGFGGIYGVGKQGEHAPRLIVLTQKAATAQAAKKVALVGKGIVYDTGGLSLKISGGMVGMKTDCGGAAALFAAFAAAVESQQYDHIDLHCVLCLAENAIGPKAMRNDDILHMFSGKTVEINNTDAEGRLVLADGVSYASRVLKADLVLDMATLTGAQLVTTGVVHAGLMCSSGASEAAGIRAGLRSGDVVHPLLFAPELLRSEFDSKFADMRNSVSNRANAQSSCAGTFIYDHLAEDFKGTYMHLDIAGPSTFEGRCSGFGVAFVLDLLKNDLDAACATADGEAN